MRNTNTKTTKAPAIVTQVATVAETVTAPTTAQADVALLSGNFKRNRFNTLQGVKYVANPATGALYANTITIATAMVGTIAETAINAAVNICGLTDFSATVQNPDTAKKPNSGIINAANATVSLGSYAARLNAVAVQKAKGGDFAQSADAMANALASGKVADLQQAAHIVNALLWAHGQLSGKQTTTQSAAIGKVTKHLPVA